jgi:hypothetical protein
LDEYTIIVIIVIGEGWLIGRRIAGRRAEKRAGIPNSEITRPAGVDAARDSR